MSILSADVSKALRKRQKMSGSGRPSGGHNKVGHKAGGDRKSIKVAKRAKDQHSLTCMGFNKKVRDGGDEDDSSIRSDKECDNQDREESIWKHKALEDHATEAAIDALEKYANGLPNGTINTMVGEEEDKDNKTVEQKHNNTNVKKVANEKKKPKSKKLSSSVQAY